MDACVSGQCLSQASPMKSNLHNINTQSEGTLLYGSSAPQGIQSWCTNSGT